MLQTNSKLLNKVIEMSKINSGNFEKSFSSAQFVINNTLKLSADQQKIKLDTIHMGKDYFSGLSISIDNSTGQSIDELYFNLEKFEAILDTFENGRDITIDTDEKLNVIISDGKRKGVCPTLIAGNVIPILPSMPDTCSRHRIPACILKEMLGKVRHSIAPKDEVRAVLKGMNLIVNSHNTLTVACVDGKRLAMDSSSMVITEKFETYSKDGTEFIKEDVNVVVPERTMIKLLKLLEGRAEIRTQTEPSPSGIQFTFTGENYEVILYSSLIEGKFPNFNQVFPKGYDSKIEISKKDITNILKGHKKFTDKLYKLEGDREKDNFETVLKVDDNILNIISGHTDHGVVEDSLNVKVEKSCLTTKKINISTRYLLEGIQEVYGDTITMKLNGEYSPVVVTGNNGYQAIIMPIKVKK